MASFPNLRRGTRSATAESQAVHSFRRIAVVLVALAALLSTAFFAVSELATLRGAKAPDASAFLTRELGSPQSSSSLVRLPAPGVKVTIRHGGFRLEAPEGTLSLTAAGTGASEWRKFEHGALRSTPLGEEAVTVGATSVEESLRVLRHHGSKTWRWHLRTRLEPRTANGHVGFFSGHVLVPLELAPVRILDDAGKDVTPKGAHWSVVRRGENTWLELALDDSSLPAPYTIDPQALRTSGASATIAGAGTLTLTIPSTVRDNDLLVMHAGSRGGSIPSTTASGWTAITNAGQLNATAAQNAWWKKATASLGGTTVNVTVGAASVGYIDVIKGADTSQANPIRHTPAGVSNNSNVVTCPQIVTNVASEFLVCIGAVNNSATWPATGGTYTLGTSAGNAANVAIALYWDDVPTQPSTIGATNITATGSAAKSVGGAFGITPDGTNGPNAHSLALSSVSPAGAAYVSTSGTQRIYYNGNAGGSFKIDDTLTDNESAAESVDYPLLNASGWTPVHSTESVTTPTAGVFRSSLYTWTAGASVPSAAERTVVGKDGFGNPTNLVVPFVNDAAVETAGALTVSGVAASGVGTSSYDSDGSFAIDLRTDYTETQSATQSGIASSTLVRTSASYTAADTCGAFGSPTTISGNPSQSGLTTGCYKYTLTGTDNVGNTASISTVVKVDTSAPGTPTLAFANVTGGAYYPGSGTRVYFKPDAVSGGFDVSSTMDDADSGVAAGGYNFPAGSAIGTNWSGSGSGSTRTYSYSATASTNGAQTVSETNRAGLTGSTATFNVTADSTAPATGGALTANGVAASSGGSQSYDGDGAFPLDVRTDYSESQSTTQSGLASSTLVRTSASFTSEDTCGAFGSPTTISGNPSQSGLATGCYRYTLTGTDNVGNTVSLSTVVKVDTSAPPAPTLTPSNATGGAYYPGSGTRVYFKPDAATGSFDLAAASSDGESGVAAAGFTFPAGSAIGTNWSASGTGSSRTYSYTATATTSGSQNVTATNRASLTSGPTSFDVALDATAPSVGALTVNGVAASAGGSQSYDGDGSFAIGVRTDYTESQTPTASGLASSVLTRASASYASADTCGSFGAPTTISGNPTQSGLGTGCYRYTLTGTDNVGNAVAVSTIVKVDTTAPTAPNLTLSNAGGGVYYSGSGSRVFFRPGAATGSFDVAAGSSDDDSGVASYAFPAGSAIGTNWTASGSGSSRTYSYTATATTNGSQNVTATNNANLTSGASSFDVTADSTAPAAGALTVNGVVAGSGGSQSYDSDGSFPIDVRTDYAEAASATASGLASSTLVRTSASFTAADTCGAFGSPTTISGSPSQSGLATGCYRYTLTGTDNVGNTVSVSTTVKIDASAPSAPSLSFANAGGGVYYSGSGTRVYFRPDAATGAFDLSATSTDDDSGVASYTFPTGAAVGTSWSASGSGATRTYSYIATATTNGPQNVSATNNAGLASGATSFDVTADSTAPAGGALTVNGLAAGGGGTTSYDVDGSFSIDVRTDYTEAQSASASGLASSTLVRTTASYSSPNVCGSFGSPTTISGNPSQSGLATGCYRYTLTGTDNVGNAVSVSTTVKVDTSPPTQPALAFSAVSGGAYYSGSGARVFFKANAAGGGSFDLTASSTDNDTDVAGYQFPSGATVGTNWSFAGSGATRTYSYIPTATTNGSQSVTATNNAGGISAGASFDVASDATSPAGGALSVNGIAASGGGSASYDGDGSFAIDGRTDYSESASSSESGLASSTLTRASATLSSDSCGSFGSPTTLAGTPAQNGLATGCYRYTLTGTDNVGNAVSISTTVKVDTSAPSAPTLTFSNTTGGVYHSGSGSRVFFRPNAAAGSFEVGAGSSDSDTGVASYSFPSAAAVGTNWTVSGAGAGRTYSYTSTATTNGTQTVNATNPASVTSANTSFDVTADSTAPTGGALTVNGATATGGGSASYDADGSFAIDDRTDYTEPASTSEAGLAASTLTRESATLSSDSCGGFGSATTLVGTPAQSGLATGCYRYRLTGTDNVGNAVSVTTIVKVDASAPSAPSLSFSNVAGGAYHPGSGTTLFFRPAAASGSFDVTASATDGDTGVAGYQFPAGSALGTNWADSGSGASRTYSFTAVATTNGPQNVTATNTAGGVSANATFTLAADANAPTTSAQCNGAACIAGYYTSSPVSVTLGGDDGTGSGLQKIRYTTDGSDPTQLNGSDYAGAISINATTTVKFRAYDNVGNEEAVGSQTILLDGTPPAGPTLTLTENPTSGAQHVSGTTLFYRPGATGTFRVAAATDDPQTGVAQVAFPSIANVTGGSTQTSSPYQEDYSWGASTADSGSHNVVATNGAGATSSTGFTLTPDSAAPTGQTITLTGVNAPYVGSASVAFSLGDGTDGTDSGIDTSTRTVTRETGDLVADSCSNFSADVGSFSSPDTAVSGGRCYRYTFTVSDNVGNVSSAVTATAKVDTAAPSLALTPPAEVTGAASQHYDAGTKTQFFRPGGSGSFTLRATASDVDTGVTDVAFPDVSATSGWSGSTGGTDATSPYASPATYTWSSGAAEPGAHDVVATDAAANTAADTITMKADGTAPTGQTLTLTGADAPYFTSPSVSFTTGDGSDNSGGSGLDTSTRAVTRETGDLSSDSCSNFSGDGGTFTSPDTAVSGGHCYRYTFSISDNVGNVSAAVTATGKVDTTPPTTPTLSFGSFTSASATGTTVFFREGSSGAFTVSSSATDSETGVASTSFPVLGGGWTATGGAYGFDATATAPSGSQDVTARNAAGADSAAATFTVVADSTAPTTSSQCDGAACASGWYTTSPVSVTLNASDGAGAGVDRIRYTTDGSDPTPVNGSDYTGAISVASTTTVKYRAYDKLGNAEPVRTQVVQIDTSAPTTPVLALTESSPFEFVSGTTLFYNPSGSNSGSFTVDAATTSLSGIQKVNFPALTAMTGGGDDPTSPYLGSYGWDNTATTSPGTADVTAYSNSGLTAQASFSVAKDVAAPSGQTISLAGANAPYYGTASVSFTLGDGSDGTGAGLDLGSRTVTRERATLSGDSCGSFSADGGSFSSPDTAVSGGHCYRYTFTISDKVGNVSAAVTATAKVDTAAPSVSVIAPPEISGAGNQYYDPGTKTLYFRSTGSGSFDLAATASDSDTAVTDVSFPDLSALAGWSGSGGADTSAPYGSPSSYSWSAGAAEPGARSVSASDKATNSASDTITIADDTTAPSGQAISLTGAGAPYATTASVSFSLTDGSDGGSGLDLASRTVTRESGDLAADSCSNFSADAGTYTSPDTAVSGGHCYRYTFTIADNVGNVSAPVSVTAKVDTSAPSAPALSFSALTNVVVSGQTVYYRPAAGSGSFTVTASSADAETGIASYSFPAAASGWTRSLAGASATYSHTGSPSDPSEPNNVHATNGAGTAGADSSFTVTPDATAPTSSAQCNGSACSAGWYTSSPVSLSLSAVDSGSGLDKIRSTTDGSDPSPLNGSDYGGAISIAATTTVKFRAYDLLGNEEAVSSQLVRIDTSAPSAPSLTLAESSPYEAITGTQLFYNPSGSNSGSFTVDGTSADAQSGIDKLSFPALTGMAGGGDDSSSPYQGAYSWTNSATTEPGAADVSAFNNAGLSAQNSFTVTKDVAAPSGQTITVSGANAPYSKTASVSFATGNGSDSGAGLDLASAQVTRENATLAGDACGSFSADAGTFASPDTSVSGGHCYRYTFTISDRVGNVSASVSVTAKVDTAAPSVSVSAPSELSGAGNQYYDAATKTHYFRSTGSGSFDLAATASDSDTAVTDVSFPDLSALAGWSGSGGSDSSSPYRSPSTYAWSAGAAAPAGENVVTTDKATNSASDTITIADDTTAPSGQAISLTGAGAPYATTASVSFSLTDGSDGGSGLDLASRTVTRETGDLAADSCSNFSADAGTYTSPDTAVSGGHCYRYTFTIADNVGNVATAVTATAKVDTTAPTAPTISFGSPTNASASGTTVFFRQGQTGGFTVSAASTDPETGVASTNFPALGSGWSNTGGVYSFDGSAAAPSGNQTVTARNGAGIDSAAATFTVSADTAAPTTSGQCNGSACSSGWYAAAPVSLTLAASDGSGSGVDRIRYTTDGSDPSPVNGSDYAGPIAVASTMTVKFRAYDLVGNEEPVGSQLVRIDTTAPTVPSLTLSEASPFELVTGTTLFYNPSGSNSGSFTADASAGDADSGIEKLSFPTLTGMSGGGDDTGSPYQGSYSWTSSATTSPGANDVTAHNNARLTAQTPFTVTKDVAAPTGGSVDYPNGFQTSTSVTITTADGNDGTGAGVDATSGVIERQTATLSNGACGSFGAWSMVTSPDTVASGTCAAYRYRVSDRVGNEAVYTSANVVEVDTSAPATPTLTLSESSPLEFDSGTTVYYNPTASNAASFTVGATAADAQSGIAQIDFPSVFGGDSSSQGSGPFSNDYSWTGGASASGTKTVTATNGAGLQTAADFTVTPDTTAPSGGTFDYPDGYSATGAVTITAPNPTDGGAGIDASSAVLERQTATLSGGGCGGFGGWSSVTSPDTVASGLCAVYRFRISDNVGNEATYASAHVVKVDSAGPTVSLTDPGTPVAGAVAISATASDPLSNVQQVVFERAAAGGSTWTQIGAPDTTAPYSVSWNTTLVADGLYDLRAIATDTAGNSTTSSVVGNRRVDNTAPDSTIDSSPANPSNEATPTFTFSSSESGSTFECKVDGGSWSSCSSPHTLAALAEGSHTFDVRATDAAGNADPTPASRTWTVDLTAPTAVWNGPAAGANVSGAVALDAGSEPSATIAYSYSPAGANTWTSTSSSWNTVPLADGPYDLRAIATDTAGNASAPAIQAGVNVDNHEPTVSITAPTSFLNASDPNPFTITASSPDSDLAGVEFYECSDTSTDCSTGSWNLIGSDPAAPYSASWNAPVADGRKAIRALATDNASNTGADVKTITIDRAAPAGVSVSYPGGYAAGAVTITSDNGPDPDVNGASAVLDRQTATLTNDSCGAFGGFSAVTSPDAVPSGQCAKYRYRVADLAGNVATATSAAVVKRDTAAPTSLQDDPGAYLRQTVSLTASASDTGGSGIASLSFERRPAGGGSWAAIGGDATAPYSVTFDTTLIADGVYDFRTVATDAAGNAEASPTVVPSRRIDNTPPAATMLSPADGGRMKGAVALTASTSDAGSGVASFSFELAPVPGAFGSVATPWDTTGVIDGDYRLRVAVTDNAGNATSSAAVTTTVDNTPPSLIFSSPAAGSVVSGTVALTATATDASPASPTVSFAYKLHSEPPSAYTSTPASWNTAAIADGLYDLRATAGDAAGNTTQVENTSILADNFPPTISITAPAPSVNAAVASPTAFDATATDGGSGVQTVDFYECSNNSTDCASGTWSLLVSDSTPPYGASWAIPADGNHALRAVSTDNANHTSAAIRNVTVDRTAPDTTITGRPANPSNASPTFTFASTETGSSFECALDGAAWASCTSPKTYPGLADGTHTLDVRATDAAGNVDPTPDGWTWLRDTTAPTGTIGDPGVDVRLSVNLTSTQSDPGGANASGVATTQFEYSGNGGSSWAATPPAWNTSAVTDGLYQVHVVITDNAGNRTTVAVGHDVRVDNTAPTTTHDDPGQFLRATKTLTGSAADSGSGVDHVEFQRSPAGADAWTTIAPDASSPYSASFDTTTVADGHYDFRTVAYDVAGNEAASAPVANRLVDNTAPTATMSDPGPYVRATVNLTSATSDPNGANGSGVVSVAYEYSTDGGTTWTPTTAAFNTTAVADGNVQLHVLATDNAGNVGTSAAVSDLVDNTRPVTTDDAPSGYQSSAVTVTLSPSDAGSGVNVTQFAVDGGSFQVGTSVTVPAPADGSNDGAHAIAYFSADNAGNIEQVKSTTVLIDATPPTCPSCAAADYLRGTVTLSASPSGGASGIQSVRFQYSPTGLATWTTIGVADTTGPAPYTADWNTTTVADGHYDLRIIVVDGANNSTTTTLPDKVVDNTDPNVATVGAPTEGAVVSGNVAINASAADVTSPIASVEFLVRGASLGTDTSAPYSLTWNSASALDGAATIQVIVTDLAGNSRTSAVRTVIVDNGAPAPALADPGAYLRGTVALAATSDADTTQVDFQRAAAGSGTWTTIATDNTTPFSASLNTTLLPEGVYDLRVVAVDVHGNTGTSAVRADVRVDNTAPSGTLAAPAAGATVGGSSVNLAASTSDAGSGVASVRYEHRPTGGTSFTAVATSTTSPFGATWDTSGLASGSYDVRPVISDRAGNVFEGSVVTVAVDVTAPTVALVDPGAVLSGSVQLSATVTGSGATKVTFGISPAAANSWSAIATDTTAPYAAAFDTSAVADGLYDLRAVVSDALGNTSQSVRSGIRIDNDAPRLLSSTPGDGARVDDASSIELVLSEPATATNVTLDGAAAVAPVVNGAKLTYGTGALAVGAHTLAGELKDASGHSAQFRIHFTIWKLGSAGVAPMIEKNTSAGAATHLTAADGFASVTMPAGAWAPQGNDWLVLRVRPLTPPTGLTNGFGPAVESVDVTAYWALAGGLVHELAQPIQIVLPAQANGVVPATSDGGGWRVLRRVPSPPALPAAWDDGFYTDAAGFHALTRHLTQFTLLRDFEAPSPPTGVRGYSGTAGLKLSWKPGPDNSGTYDHVSVLVDGKLVGAYAAGTTEASVAASASSAFTLRETDLAGNESEEAKLKPVPVIIGLSPEDAAAVLEAAGFHAGRTTQGGSGAAGTVSGPAGLVLAEAGATIDLTVAGGDAGVATKFVFGVISAAEARTTQPSIGARVKVTRAARVTAVLYSPRNVKLYTWRFALRAGRSIVQLRLPSQVRRPGVYRVRWMAKSGRDVATRTLKLRLVGTSRGLGPVVDPRPLRVEVVLAGGNLQKGPALEFGPKGTKVVAAAGADAAFDLAGASNRNVQVIVVDVDEFGVGFVRDLHTVFPRLKIVALSSSSKRLAAAMRAGASVALPRSTPNSTLARVVTRLLRSGRH